MTEHDTASDTGHSADLRTEFASNPAAAGQLAQLLSKLKSAGGSGNSADDSVSDLAGGDAGSYQLGEVVARGGMGAIISARDVNIRRNVAMKVMLNPEKADETSLLRFIEEAQITGQLEHPGVVPVHQLGVDDNGSVFYTMKFVRGLTLAQIAKGLKSGDAEMARQYPLGRLLTIFLKICDTMAFAHSRNVIHRDLKPDNVMVGEYGEVLVMDWGLGKVLSDQQSVAADRALSPVASAMAALDGSLADASASSAIEAGSDTRVDSVRSSSGDDTGKTMHGAIMGTPVYMPPEQAQGEIDNLDARADIYSLGAILYNLLTLAPPLTGKTPMDVLLKVSRGEIVPPHKRPELKKPGTLPHCPNNAVPESLAAVTMKAMACDKAERYETVSDLQVEIEAYQAGFATQAEEAGTWKQAKLFIQRNRGLAAGVAAVFVALTVGMSAAMVQWNRAVAAREQADAHYEDLKQAQAAREVVSHGAAPEFVSKARELLASDRPDQAWEAIDTALGLHPELADAWHEKGRLHIDRNEFVEAQAAFQQVLALSSDGPMRDQAEALSQAAAEYAGFTAEGDGELLTERLLTLASTIEGVGDTTLAGRLYSRTGDTLKGLQIRVLAALHELETVNDGLQFRRGDGQATEFDHFHWHHVTREDGLRLGLPSMSEPDKLISIAPLTKLPVKRLLISYSGISNLNDVREMPLVELNAASTKILGIQELAGSSIEKLDISTTRVTDISPLASMPLKSLSMRELKIESLQPLTGLELETLDLHSCFQITDLSPLAGMPLKSLELKNTKVEDLSPLRGLPLEQLSLSSVATDLSVVTSLPLKTLSLPHTQATDLRPLAGLTLERLAISSQAIRDFTPLREVTARHLEISSDTFDDLSLIAHMPLETLTLQCKKVTDLTPLAGMKLKQLKLVYAGVEDLQPLFGMPLTRLEIVESKVRDLTPLLAVPLQHLTLVDSPVDNISVVKGMSLMELYLVGCPNLHDLTPIAELDKLARLAIPEHCRDIEFLREMESIYNLSNDRHHKPVAQFWREFDARDANQ